MMETGSDPRVEPFQYYIPYPLEKKMREKQNGGERQTNRTA